MWWIVCKETWVCGGLSVRRPGYVVGGESTSLSNIVVFPIGARILATKIASKGAS